MAALPEQVLRMCLLKITGAYFARRDMGRDAQNRHTRAMRIEKPIDEMEVAGPATAGADRQFAGEMSLACGGKRRHLFVPHMNPFDLALAAQRVGQPVETITDDSVNAFDARLCENFGKLVSNSLNLHDLAPPSRRGKKCNGSRKLW